MAAAARPPLAAPPREKGDDQTVTSFCLYCGATLTWTRAFCLSAPKEFPYFDCGRHDHHHSPPSEIAGGLASPGSAPDEGKVTR